MVFGQSNKSKFASSNVPSLPSPRKHSWYSYESSNKTYPRSGIPEYLRLLVKPLVDAAIAGEKGYDFSHHGPKQTGLTLADVNYIADCYVHPEHCL